MVLAQRGAAAVKTGTGNNVPRKVIMFLEMPEISPKVLPALVPKFGGVSALQYYTGNFSAPISSLFLESESGCLGLFCCNWLTGIANLKKLGCSWLGEERALKTVTSFNKESRPFFLGDSNIWSVPSVSSLSDYSNWRSRGLF